MKIFPNPNSDHTEVSKHLDEGGHVDIHIFLISYSNSLQIWEEKPNNQVIKTMNEFRVISEVTEHGNNSENGVYCRLEGVEILNKVDVNHSLKSWCIEGDFIKI